MNIVTMWGYILRYASNYGADAVKYCYRHKYELLNLGIAACNLISDIFGV